MAESSSTILIRLLSTGDLSALTKGREQSEALKVSLEGLREAMGLLGVGISVGAIVEGTKAAIEYGASIKHISEQANISAEAFQKLSYIAAGAGVKQDELGTALNVLNRNLAQAADGATKQNKAITDLGLSTDDLLAMPVEKQIEAIAKAYSEATDKTKAWADVTALLGKNSAHVREVLKDIAEHGTNGGGFILSDADIERLDKWERFFTRAAMQSKALAVKPLEDFVADVVVGDPGPKGGDHAVQRAADAAARKAEREAEVQEMPEVVASHQALTKALGEENRAFETSTQAAKRLRAEADTAEWDAFMAGHDKGDAKAQKESDRLKIEASNLRRQANAEDAKAAKESSDADAAQEKFLADVAQLETKKLSIQEQLAQAKGREDELGNQLHDLDENSITFLSERKRIEDEILQVKREISSLEDKDASRRVELTIQSQELQNKMEAIKLAAIEHDYTISDTEKWEEKRAAIEGAVAAQTRQLAILRAEANDPTLTQGARDKASHAAGQREDSILSLQNQGAALGPDPHSFTQNLKKDLADLQKQWGTLQQNMAHGLTGVIQSGFASVSREIGKAIMGAETLGQAFQNIAIDIGETLVQALVDMGVQWIATEAMKLAFGTTAKAADTATTVAAAEAASLAWAVPAALASVASFGAADIAGMAGLTAAVAEAATIGAVGFADGGYTGGIEGQAAGIVHGNEFVWSAPAVRAVGVGNLERAHQAALGGGGGVATGGAASGRASGNIILAMSPGDVAKSQRANVDARVIRMSGMIPQARYAI